MAWDFSTEPEFQAQLDWMREFVINEIEPIELFFDDMTAGNWRKLTAPLKEEVKKRGLWACHLDPELGGQGYGQVKLALMHEILGRSGPAPNIFGNQAPDSGNSELIAIGATPEQREKWLEPLLRGEMTSSFSMTEPHYSGSDPTMIKTFAVRDGDEYVINGHKWFASNAAVADFILMMVVTNPDNPPHKAASMIIIPKGTPGLNIARNVYNMHHPYPGHFRAGGHAEIFLENCRVPVANRIGGEGDGFVLAQKRLNGGRIHHAMRWVGQCNRAFEMMCERAVSRSTKGQLLGQKQMIQEMIADSAVEIRALRLLALHSAWVWDTQGASRARMEIAQLKFWGAKVLQEVVDRAIQVHGALGWTTDLPLARMFVLARQMRIADGADEVHKAFVAERSMKAFAPVEGWPSEHIPTRRAQHRDRFVDYLDNEVLNDVH
ncbi:MAG TPA: acyl-CoA dehydrogenase family protein [Acidimicrobiales bacterium]|nr:acyl-CoA dehydrogenase family protein [Acidimicrobiales bacterium]